MKEKRKVSITISILLMLTIVASAFSGMEENVSVDGPTSTISFYGEKTDVYVGEEILTRFSIENSFNSNSKMHIQLIVHSPFSTGQFVNNYGLEPGEGMNVDINLMSDRVGDFNINGRAIYYFDEDKNNVHNYVFDLPVKVREQMTAVATPVTMDDNSRNELNKLDSDGIKYVLISIRDFAFNPDIMYVEPNVAVFIFNEDTKTHYVKFGLNNEYHDVRSGTIFSFCCGNDEVVVEYEDRDYVGMKGKIVVRSTQINPPSGVPGGKINGYDKIYGWHEIILCNPVSDAERLVTDLTEKNCGNPDLNIDHYPLDLLPSGGNSGNVSASEMIMAKVKIAGHISLVPWRTQHVKMIWYNESGRIMFVADRDANSFNPEVMSYIGRFSWEINKPGPYYIDIDAGDMGNARVVFNVTGSGVIATPIPTVSATPIVTATVTATATPIVTATATATPIVTYTQTNPPAPEVDNPGPGCWNSYIGFGICVGDVATKTGAGILLGIGKGIADMLGW